MAKNSRQTQWVTASVVALLAVALFVLVWLMFFMSPTKGQYSAASKQAGNLKISIGTINESNRNHLNNMVGSLFVAADGSKLVDDTKESTQAYDNLLARYDADVRKLLYSPVSRDEDVKGQFSAVLRQNRLFKQFMNQSVQDFPTYYKARAACDPLSRQDVNGYLKQVGACTETLDILVDADFTVFSQYAKAKHKNVTATTKAYKRVAAGEIASTDMEFARLAADDEALDVITDFETARAKAISTEELETLIALLDQKAAK